MTSFFKVSMKPFGAPFRSKMLQMAMIFEAVLECFLEGPFSLAEPILAHLGAHFGGVLEHLGLMRNHGFTKGKHHFASFGPSLLDVVFGSFFWKAS